jgi:hypothetical protein
MGVRERRFANNHDKLTVSFKDTSAALEIKSSHNPVRIAASVFMLQGTTIMPSPQ